LLLFLFELLSPLSYAIDGTLAVFSPRARARLVERGGEGRLISALVFGAITWIALLAVAIVALARWAGVGAAG
jgi:hypothetical protein